MVWDFCESSVTRRMHQRINSMVHSNWVRSVIER